MGKDDVVVLKFPVDPLNFIVFSLEVKVICGTLTSNHSSVPILFPCKIALIPGFEFKFDNANVISGLVKPLGESELIVKLEMAPFENITLYSALQTLPGILQHQFEYQLPLALAPNPTLLYCVAIPVTFGEFNSFWLSLFSISIKYLIFTGNGFDGSLYTKLVSRSSNFALYPLYFPVGIIPVKILDPAFITFIL